ncbi:MAG: ATP-binding cassette domain-containing protein [Lutisporaceae bacterium]
MLLLEVNNIKKYYADRLILDIKDFKAYYGEKIGIVGANGAGKTTLLDIIAGKNMPEEGSIKLYGEISYITQLEPESVSEIDKRMAKEFGLFFSSLDTASGGEKTRYQDCRAAFRKAAVYCSPTSLLQIWIYRGVELLERKLLRISKV